MHNHKEKSKEEKENCCRRCSRRTPAACDAGFTSSLHWSAEHSITFLRVVSYFPGCCTRCMLQVPLRCLRVFRTPWISFVPEEIIQTGKVWRSGSVNALDLNGQSFFHHMLHPSDSGAEIPKCVGLHLCWNHMEVRVAAASCALSQ
ncbi:hypothetical protein TNCV_2865701 [Trichonephila clavipes]|nr:hypothetical protein TNCV_2865701 [Trichonephila clavipes]